MELTIEELKDLREAYANTRGIATALDELIAIRELKGEQVPVAYLTRHMGCRAPDDCEEYLEVSDKNGVSGNGEPAIPVFTAPQKPVVLPPVEKWRKPDEVRAQNAYRILVQKEIEAAGDNVKNEKRHCDKCGGKGSYQCPQMLGTVECECGNVKDGE